MSLQRRRRTRMQLVPRAGEHDEFDPDEAQPTAAASVCRDLEPGRQVALMEPYANCVRQAIGNAVVKIDRPTVTAYAAARGVLAGDTTIKIARNK